MSNNIPDTHYYLPDPQFNMNGKTLCGRRIKGLNTTDITILVTCVECMTKILEIQLENDKPL